MQTISITTYLILFPPRPSLLQFTGVLKKLSNSIFPFPYSFVWLPDSFFFLTLASILAWFSTFFTCQIFAFSTWELELPHHQWRWADWAAWGLAPSTPSS